LNDVPSAVEGQLLGRATEIGRVMARHGLRARSGDGSRAQQARALRDALEELGPTFAKLGQILSTRPDLVPREFVEELATLQEQVTPLTEAEVVAVMEQELRVPWEDVFASIDPQPMAAGTIGQVHSARLDGGELVVVKVQRPNARPDIERDLGLLELFAAKAEGREVFQQLIDIPAVIDHLSESLRRELDFREEMGNMERMREVLESYRRLEVPGVYRELSTSRLLVMEQVQGVPVRDAPMGHARKDAARELLESYYHQILGVGFFHADPHPGNMKWWDDRIYLLDFGMVGEVDQETREYLMLLLMAYSRQDTAFLADVMLMLSGDDKRTDLDHDAFERDLAVFVARHHGTSLQQIEIGPTLQGLTEISTRHRVRLPASLALTGKALAQMQLTASELDPELDPLSVASRFMLRSLVTRVRGGVDPQRVLYEGQKLKVRLTQMADSLARMTGARPGSQLQIRFVGMDRLESTVRAGARRLALAIVAGTTIVGATVTVDARVGSWLPILLGTIGGLFTFALAIDLFWRPSRR
jgi:predicted unusual protein kinase regulating ubiquinone biosynthesis (AarF/ABC1/UbiB family)